MQLVFPFGELSVTNNSISLPQHIAFVQQLDCEIKGSLSNSCAQTMSVSELCQLTGENPCSLLSKPLQYASIKGSPDFREQVVRFHQSLNQHETELNADHVLSFCGAQEALAAIYRSILEPGDEVIVVTPNYPSLTKLAEYEGARVNAIELHWDHKWQFTIENFESKVGSNTKLIVLNSPHNPSGQVVDTPLASQIIKLAKKYNCYLLTDDVAQATNPHNVELAHEVLDYDKGIAVGVMSKSFGLAGIRVGWTVSKNMSLLKNLLAVKSYGSICCSSVDEDIATLALKHHSLILDKNNQILRENIQLFSRFVEKHQDLFSWYPPSAGMLSIVKVKGVEDIEIWAQKIVNETGILILPCTLFGMQGPYFRLGLGQCDLVEMLRILDNYFKNNKQRI